MSSADDNRQSRAGKLMLILHAHLPFVRHPEYHAFLEENWLFEAITECYLPLIRALRRIEKAGTPGRITFTVTPTLASMLTDAVLSERYLHRLNKLCELSDFEIKRTKESAQAMQQAAGHYYRRFNHLRSFYLDELKGDIIGALRALQNSGRIEIFACSATHALLPLLESESSLRAQIKVGIDSHKSMFGVAPRGFWMPECAYSPDVEKILKQNGIEYFITDSHAVLHGTPLPKFGVYAPVESNLGCKVFARDPKSSKQVWSADTGYPGDPLYREFYRDLGWDAEIDYVGQYLVSHELRHDLGFKYHRITGDVPLSDKDIYQPESAAQQARRHAHHFVDTRIEHAALLSQKLQRAPLFVAPYDAELFGHWWYEGPVFIEEMVNYAAGTGLELVTASEYLKDSPQLQPQSPSVSSWGYNGYFENWLNGSNDWIYPPLHSAGNSMSELAGKYADASGLLLRALNQAARELLLAQSSDWSFILSTGTMVDYARRRVTGHLEHFEALKTMIEEDNIEEEFLARLENRNNIFPDIDYRVFADNQVRAGE